MASNTESQDRPVSPSSDESSSYSQTKKRTHEEVTCTDNPETPQTDTDDKNEARKRINRSDSVSAVDQPEQPGISSDASPMEETAHSEQPTDAPRDTDAPAETASTAKQSSTQQQLQQQNDSQASQTTANAYRAFGGKSTADDDWGEFAEEEDDDDGKGTQETEKSKQDNTQSVYKFGSTSGFGTKGWALNREATPTSESSPSKYTFGMTSNLSSLSPASSALGTKFGSSASSTSFAQAAQEAAASKPFFRSFSSASTSTPTKEVSSNASEESSSHSPRSLSSFAPVTTVNALDLEASKKEESSKSEKAKFGADAKERAAMKPKAELQTGEEEEVTLYSVRSKLYALVDGEWKERGIGVMRFNSRKDGHMRLIMRADNTHRLVLNMSLFRGMEFILNQKFITFAGFDQSGSFSKFTLKIGKPEDAAKFHSVLVDSVATIPSNNDK